MECEKRDSGLFDFNPGAGSCWIKGAT